MTPPTPLPRLRRALKYGQDVTEVYALLIYAIAASLLVWPLIPVLALLDRWRNRPAVCRHGWLVNTRAPDHRGACPVCERIASRNTPRAAP